MPDHGCVCVLIAKVQTHDFIIHPRANPFLT